MSPDLSARERACVQQVLNSAKVAYVAMVEPAGHNAGAQNGAPLGGAPRPGAPRPGAAGPDARPYVTPMNFAYEPPALGSASSGGTATGDPTTDEAAQARTGPEGRLLLHTGPGRKVDALATCPYICVSVTTQEELHLGDTPCQDGYLYQSVIVEGRAAPITGDAEREAALRALVAKYDPEAVDKPFDPHIFAQTLLYAVYIDVIGFKERPKQAQQS